MSLGPDEFLTQARGFSDSTQQWEFSQMFGEDEASQDDSKYKKSANHSSAKSTRFTQLDSHSSGTDNYISSLSFDSTGTYLAVGYNCGQVVVLYQEDEHTYQLCCEFKSHNSEFDCLTSTEIEEKINSIEWYPFGGKNPQLMTCNDKTIKLFRVMMPNSDQEGGFPVVRPRRVFSGGHAFNINSLAFNNDGETFISTDDLSINLWNIEISSEAFNIVNIKPDNMETLQEVITRSDFHPSSCNLFVYSTSKGIMRMGDLRDSSLCDRPCQGSLGGFFEELVATISDCKFSPNGHFLLSRDYLSMKVWDLRKGNEPIQRIKFNEHLIPKLCDLYESDNIFDKFGCCWSGNSMQVMSGSYNGDFYISNAFQPNNVTQLTLNSRGGNEGWNQFDTSNKALHLDWHPKQDIISVGAKDCGYIYVRKTVEDDR